MALLRTLSTMVNRQLPQTERLIQRQDPHRPREAFSDDYLTRMLRRQDEVPQESRLGGEYLHVSQLMNLCLRQHVLVEEMKIEHAERITGGHKVMWRLGRAAEHHVRESIIRDRNRYGILGRWECVCGRHGFDGLYSPAYGHCRQCHGLPTVYKEAPLRDEVSKIVGNPDLPLYVDDQLLIVEIKSMDGDAFAELKEPKPDHVFQGHAYRKLAEVQGFRTHPKVAIIYVSKKFKFGQPYKEFHVELEPIVGTMLEQAWTEARQLAEDRRAGRLPVRGCTNIRQPRARQCPCATQCFQRRA